MLSFFKIYIFFTYLIHLCTFFSCEFHLVLYGVFRFPTLQQYFWTASNSFWNSSVWWVKQCQREGKTCHILSMFCLWVGGMNSVKHRICEALGTWQDGKNTQDTSQNSDIYPCIAVWRSITLRKVRYWRLQYGPTVNRTSEVISQCWFSVYIECCTQILKDS
jgi:hypothetical protein